MDFQENRIEAKTKTKTEAEVEVEAKAEEELSVLWVLPNYTQLVDC